MKKKAPTIKELKEKLDKVFSYYIRLRDADENGYCKCCTCGKKFHWKKIQNGHWISRGKLSTRFHEQNCNSQCLTKESNIRMMDGTNKSIKDIRVGNKLAGFNEKTFKKENSEVLFIKSFIPKKLYEVEMENGEKFFATPDHRIVVNKEWKRVDELLHDCSARDMLEI